MRWIRIGIVGSFLLTAVLAALVGGSAGREVAPGTEGLASTVPASPPDLSASAEIRRSFMEPGQVAIAVTNHGEAAVRVVGVELVTKSFAPLGVQEFDATVPPSVNPRDLLVRYGEARCPDGVESTAEPSSAVLSVATEDGAAHEVTVALPHPNGTLDRLLGDACAAQAVAASARIVLGELSEAADGTLEGTLNVTPLGEATLHVTEVRGSVLFEIAAGEAVPGASDGGAGEHGGLHDGTAEGLAAGEGAAPAVPLVFDAHRCEGHAVGDAKQPFGFTAWIVIDGGAPIATPIEVGERHREVLWAMLEARCADLE